MDGSAERVAWVDYAKGFCIIMVVMMHSVLGVEKELGALNWTDAIVAFAKPFRMPDFFLISGLFIGRVIDRDWRRYLDRKVVHFAYFYVLWVTINFVFRAPGMVKAGGVDAVVGAYLFSFIEPFGTMWFIYLLPIFAVVVKLARRVPWWVMWPLAAALEILHVNTGWTVPDEFCARFVYFYTGTVFAPHVFRVAAGAIARPWRGALYLLLWAAINATLVALGRADDPGVSLVLGLLGAQAVVVFSSLLSKSDRMAPLRYCGRNSIVVYLAFVLFMGPARVLLLRIGIEPGTAALLVTAAGVIGPILLFWAVRNTPFRLLFERPQWARLEERPLLSSLPAE